MNDLFVCLIRPSGRPFYISFSPGDIEREAHRGKARESLFPTGPLPYPLEYAVQMYSPYPLSSANLKSTQVDTRVCPRRKVFFVIVFEFFFPKASSPPGSSLHPHFPLSAIGLTEFALGFFPHLPLFFFFCCVPPCIPFVTFSFPEPLRAEDSLNRRERS